VNPLTFTDVDDASSADDAERRIAPRTKTLKRGKVYFNNMSSTFDCVVRNISSTGALLTLDESAHLPKEFDIRIGEERALRAARLVYRRGVLAGVHFSGSGGVDDPLPASAADVPMGRAVSPDDDRHPIAKIAHAPLPRTMTRHFRWS
jgi:hypothetical protein